MVSPLEEEPLLPINTEDSFPLLLPFPNIPVGGRLAQINSSFSQASSHILVLTILLKLILLMTVGKKN